MTYDWVSFTTDYGTADGFVAACKGVLAARAPAVRVIDVTHQVPPQDVRRGAAVLAQTAPWLPPAVHLAVVDPGVGTDRRGIAIVAARGVLVGPDNGLLPPAADALGGITAAYELSDPAYHLPRVSTTFHGRDVFAPVAAHLCLGLDPAALGPPVRDPVRLPAPSVHSGPGELRAEVLTVDVFGNVQLAATAADLTAAGLGPADGSGSATTAGPAGSGHVDIAVEEMSHPATMGRTFGDVDTGQLVVIVDSEDLVGIAVNQGDAAARLGIGPGDEVAITAASAR